MKQTLLAFLAMSMFSLLALSQQRSALKYHGMVHGRDVEMAAQLDRYAVVPLYDPQTDEIRLP